MYFLNVGPHFSTHAELLTCFHAAGGFLCRGEPGLRLHSPLIRSQQKTRTVIRLQRALRGRMRRIGWMTLTRSMWFRGARAYWRTHRSRWLGWRSRFFDVRRSRTGSMRRRHCCSRYRRRPSRCHCLRRSRRLCRSHALSRSGRLRVVRGSLLGRRRLVIHVRSRGCT